MASALNEEEKLEFANIATSIKDNLLDLKLPAGYRDLHLELVIAFNDLEEGLYSTKDVLEATTDKIDSLVKKYTWLKK